MKRNSNLSALLLLAIGLKTDGCLLLIIRIFGVRLSRKPESVCSKNDFSDCKYAAISSTAAMSSRLQFSSSFLSKRVWCDKLGVDVDDDVVF